MRSFSSARYQNTIKRCERTTVRYVTLSPLINVTVTPLSLCSQWSIGLCHSEPPRCFTKRVARATRLEYDNKR
ncbi:hypothetical protein Y032_0059g3001 [Ancylostoma ceylanicum]|uniref:Uncharacterized protein n=1 Tax=Ancylostoma ceylanicum TaxID=53326 RepID=A0A016U4D5_9BILA|nr:hypothetical protein Y032_0059g3001 [Ancylostoma ceylanicum]